MGTCLIVMRQLHCCETASLLWGSHIAVRQPHFREADSLLWGSLIAVRQPHFCSLQLPDSLGIFFATFSTWISSFMVPQSPHSGSASTLIVLATFYNSAYLHISPSICFLICPSQCITLLSSACSSAPQCVSLPQLVCFSVPVCADLGPTLYRNCPRHCTDASRAILP